MRRAGLVTRRPDGRRASASASEPAWSPSAISGVALWVHPEAGVTRVVSTASAWEDQSNAGNDLAPLGATSPTIMGHGWTASHPAMACATNQGLRADGAIGALVSGSGEPWTATLQVFFPAAASATETIFAWGDDGDATAYIRVYRSSTGELVFQWRTDGDVVTAKTSTGTPLAAAGRYLLTVRTTGTVLTARLDGSDVPFTGGSAVSMGASTLEHFALAHLWRGGAQAADFANVRFATVIIVGRDLTDEEILTAEEWCTTSYPHTSTRDAGNVLIYCGQSNCGGRVTFVDGVAPPSGIANPNANVQFSAARDYDSLGWLTLRAPIDDGGTHATEYGPAIHLGHALYGLRNEGFSIIQYSIGATNVDAWISTHNASMFAHVDRALDSSGTSAVTHVIWQQGENEATSEPSSLAYEAELTTHVTALQAEYPGAQIVIVRLSDTQTLYPYVANVQAAQEAVAAALGCLLVDTDSATSDTQHFDAGGVETVGENIAATIDWTPETPSGLVLWADYAVGVTDVSGDASAVADQSSAGNDGTTASAGVRPLIEATGWNGTRPSLLFTAANNDLIEFNGVAAQFSGTNVPYTMHRLIQRTGAETGERYDCGLWQASSVFPAVRSGQQGASNARILHSRDDPGVESSTVGAASSALVTTRHQITMWFDGTTRRLYVDGVLIDDDTTVLGACTFDRFGVGKWRTTNSYDHRRAGDFVYNRALTAEELFYLWGYSRAHFGGLL